MNLLLLRLLHTQPSEGLERSTRGGGTRYGKMGRRKQAYGLESYAVVRVLAHPSPPKAH